MIPRGVMSVVGARWNGGMHDNALALSEVMTMALVVMTAPSRSSWSRSSMGLTWSLLDMVMTGLFMIRPRR